MVIKLNRKSINLIITLILSLFTLYISYTLYKSKNSLVEIDKKSDNGGIYVLSEFRKVVYLSPRDYSVITEIKVKPSMHIAYVGDGKIYVAVRGDLDWAGQEINVIKNGKMIKKIKLTYSLPRYIRYNPYNGKVYIWHVPKITKYKENCITVINPKDDTEETNIMYNRCVEDIVFSKDNTMIVSSDDLIKPENSLDVFDLKDNSIIKSIPIDIKITSMQIADNNLLFCVTEMLPDPYVYVVDWKKGIITDKIKLSYDYPNKVYKINMSNKEYILITHANVDNGKGHGITIIDPLTRKIVKEIPDVINPYGGLAFKDNIMLVANQLDDKVYIYQDFQLVKEIPVEHPMTIVFAD